VQIMLGAVIDVARDEAPGLWRRHLEIIVQGMRATPAPPSPLGVATSSFERTDHALRGWRSPRRA